MVAMTAWQDIRRYFSQQKLISWNAEETLICIGFQEHGQALSDPPFSLKYFKEPHSDLVEDVFCFFIRRWKGRAGERELPGHWLPLDKFTTKFRVLCPRDDTLAREASVAGVAERVSGLLRS